MEKYFMGKNDKKRQNPQFYDKKMPFYSKIVIFFPKISHFYGKKILFYGITNEDFRAKESIYGKKVIL